MGVSKTEIFSLAQNRVAKLARVLAHPARVAILEHLLDAKSCINSTLVDEIGLAQATISQHLRELKEVGLIKGTVEGNTINYCIDFEIWESSRIVFENFFRDFGSDLDCNC